MDSIEYWIEERIKTEKESVLEIVRKLIKKDDLTNPSKKRDLSVKRFYLFWVLYKQGYKHEYIGSLFLRDRTTVVHGVNQYLNLKHYKDVKFTIQDYKRALNNGGIYQDT